MPAWNIHVLETPEEMSAVEDLQRQVWPGSETDVVPAHLLITVVHNGVDVDRFRPRDQDEARRGLGLPAAVPIVGMVASFKPQKNHLLFLEVARRVLAGIPEALFVCAGEPLSGAGAGSLRSPCREPTSGSCRVLSEATA